MNFRKLSHVFYAIHFLQEQYITPINIFQENYSFSERCHETNLFFLQILTSLLLDSVIIYYHYFSNFRHRICLAQN